MTTLNISIQSQIKSTVESDVEFSVSFDDAWQWLEYSRKDNAKVSFLNCGFIEEVDYIVSLVNQENSSGGRPSENIYLTKDCLKSWAMMSNTSRGKEVRAYFIKCEKELKEIKSLPAKPVDIVLMLEQAASAIKEARQLAAAAESKVIELQPKVEMYNIVCEQGRAIKIGEFANLVNNKKLGQNNMFKFLRMKGILQQDNTPYQKYMHHFNVVQKVNKHTGDVYPVVLVTPKGQQFLVKKLIEAEFIIKSNIVNQIIEAAADKAA